jgi:hypothetical protein
LDEILHVISVEEFSLQFRDWHPEEAK